MVYTACIGSISLKKSYQECVGCSSKLLIDVLNLIEAVEASVADQTAASRLGNFILKGNQFKYRGAFTSGK